MSSLSIQATAQNSSKDTVCNDTGLKETRAKTPSLGLGVCVAQQESSLGSTLGSIRQQASKTLAEETKKGERRWLSEMRVHSAITA